MTDFYDDKYISINMFELLLNVKPKALNLKIQFLPKCPPA